MPGIHQKLTKKKKQVVNRLTTETTVISKKIFPEERWNPRKNRRGIFQGASTKHQLCRLF